MRKDSESPRQSSLEAATTLQPGHSQRAGDKGNHGGPLGETPEGLKDLNGKITTLKKSVGGNKQKKKEVQVQVALLEKELDDRHTNEKKDLEQKAAQATVTAAGADTAEEVDRPGEDAAEDLRGRGQLNPWYTTRAEAQAEQSAITKAAEFDAIRRQAAQEAKNSVNHKEIEENAIANMLGPMNLRIKQIPPDGHCMYNAIVDQLAAKGAADGKTYKDLRRIAADFLRAYCDEVENTAAWGGQTELQAISCALEMPIHVVQMGTPVLKIGEDLDAEPLFVSYHRHAYGLGEHYNSLLPTDTRG
ncbi:uncharacterized protein EV422DRAFT_619491 [Fimicolochytrium jonesii]|uniref:uncharacterized protein n=1 Tax=Fimicolochytrium jonesii TaxID=1396493 RepID=UPI0022FED7A3|nr:uncharacterized protein EV422DRAFT_619491 [Fimicolochytrium jonesii]KAI8821738.1 hypothetical protein EV422DRAFT_619491 [Fimicolochytrium jonesii]